MVHITDHGGQRIKDRVGLSKKIADKIAEKALCLGIKHEDTKGSLRRYLDAVYLKKEIPNNIRVYNRKVYLFRNNLLITVLDLPNQYHGTVDKINKKKLVNNQII